MSGWASVPAVRVLVTGATGFTGRHLVELCARNGASVIATGRRPAAESRLEIAERYVSADLAAPGEARRVLAEAAPDAVFHLAALVSVPRSWAEPELVLRDNHLATLGVLEALRAEGADARVLVACSSEEYGPPESLPVTEDRPLRPQNPYAASKASADLLAGFYADAYGLRIARTRAFNHAGPGQSEAYVVSSMARQIAFAERSGASEVTVTTGNPAASRDFVDVRDVAGACWTVIEREAFDVFNVCTGRATPVADILAGLAEHTDLRVEQRTDPALVRENEVMEIVGSHERISQATGWAPRLELSQTLRDTLDWWRAR